jgi:hypothetical protein
MGKGDEPDRIHHRCKISYVRTKFVLDILLSPYHSGFPSPPSSLSAPTTPVAITNRLVQWGKEERQGLASITLYTTVGRKWSWSMGVNNAEASK